MKKTLLLILVTIVSLHALCQSGKLELFLSASENCDVDGGYFLYSSDSLVDKGFFFGQSLVEIDSLRPGAYTVEFNRTNGG